MLTDESRAHQAMAQFSHELRNCLGTARSAMRVLEIPDLEQSRRKKTRKLIGRQLEQMTRLVDDLLDASLIRSGQFRLECARIDLREPLAHAAEVARLRRIIVELAEVEAVIGEHHQRGVVVELVHELPDQLVGEDVHLLHRSPEVLLLRRQLAAQLAGAEEVTEEMRGRVDAFDVDQLEVGLLVAPDLETDVAIAVGGGLGGDRDGRDRRAVGIAPGDALPQRPRRHRGARADRRHRQRRLQDAPDRHRPVHV